MPKRDEPAPKTFKVEELVAETEKAWLVERVDDNERYWIPKSVGDFDEHNNRMTVAAWFYKKMQPVED